MMILSDIDQTFPAPAGSVARLRDSSTSPSEIFGAHPFHPEGNVWAAFYANQDGSDVFGLGDEGCTCPPVNIKNSSMVILGGLVGYYGVKTGNRSIDSILKVAGLVVAGIGVIDMLKGLGKAPLPQAAEPGTKGLGSEWYPENARNGYLNRFAGLLQARYANNGMEAPVYR